MRILTACVLTMMIVGCARQAAEKQVSAPEVTEKPPSETVPVAPVVIPPARPTSVPPTTPVMKPSPEPVTPTPKPAAKPAPKPAVVPVVTKTPDGKLILGAEEWLWLDSSKQYERVKVDSGVKLSTLGVADLQSFERDGNDWVKFNHSGKSAELPVERWIKRKNGDQKRQAVVKVRAKLGELNELTEFALTAGQGIVLGVNFIRDVATVDTSRKFVQPKSKR
ncbi:RimK/LysX family protein [Photobacterium sp. TY1-4]|uniref:putative ATP-dependent zinc protease n=1 Tax=Photobacterium sp. TY1-4 TaxID=2899122 RepID=UPI0021C02F03|nr:RimK/LysX family protein [Photobacterium sp. TY1-4]UXI03947.1 RimK/LysX family protein [Photobacterium sp. TY1-4]